LQRDGLLLSANFFQLLDFREQVGIDHQVSYAMRVILIVADSLRNDALGCTGSQWETPTVDRLASDGTLFERVISAAPWTVPSIAAMLTGIYSHRLGLAKWEQPWPEHHPTLFDLADQKGMKTASFVFDPTHLFRRVPSARVRILKTASQAKLKSGARKKTQARQTR